MTQRDRPREGLLLALTAVAASTDAVSYLGLGNVFPANMTGNTVLLGIGLATGSFARAGRSAVALAAFVAGAAGAGVLGRSVGWRSLVTRGLLAETALLAAACGWDLAVADAPRHALIALASLAMGLQSGIVLRLGVGVSTTYITGTWTAVSGWFADRLGGGPRGDGDGDADADGDGDGSQGARALVLGCYFGAALLAGGIFALTGRVAIVVPAGGLALTLGRRLVVQRRRLRPVVVVSRTSSAPPARVWRQLADPRSYAQWVSGTARIRRADDSWPAVGARLYHRFGLWPLRTDDRTEVLASEPPRRLVLAASALPWGSVRAELRLAATPGGTRIELCEEMLAGLGARLPAAAQFVQRLRNRRSLARLVALAEADPVQGELRST